VHLVATLLSLNSVIPEQTKATARVVVKKVVDDLLKRLENPMRQAIAGSLNRSIRNRRPKFKEINWHRTIQLNLKHYQPTFKTVIPEHLMGYGRRRSALKDIIICIDESGSMATSIVYASVFGAVMASIPSLKTSLVVFDTSVVDLTPNLQDPVDVLFGTQLGGGTNIAQALAYCQRLITRPNDTVFVLISDLYEGGNRHEMLSRVKSMKQSGVKLVTLLALNDEGAPSYDRQTAAHFAEMGIPSFACTPDLFPDLMATVLNRGDVSAWAARHEIPLPQTDDLE
jgi:Mg-chelatase subunit ChlD